jgi:hypothetical protein
MQLTSLLLALVLAVPAGAEEPKILKEKDRVVQDDYVLRLSLPTEEEVALWRSPGIRIALGYGYGRFFGTRKSTNFSAHHIILHPDFRIDDEWSIAATATYTIVGKDLSALRWSVSLEPTWHPWRGLGLALGVGYAGILGERNMQRPYLGSAAIPDYSVPAPDDPVPPAHSRSALNKELLTECQGSGWNTLTRVEYLFVAGPLFASGPFLQGDWQWVACQQTFGDIDADTGKPIITTQWWGHRGISLGWWLAWR